MNLYIGVHLLICEKFRKKSEKVTESPFDVARIATTILFCN